MKHKIAIIIATFLVILVQVIINEPFIRYSCIIGILFILLTVTLTGSGLIQFNYFVKSYNKGQEGISITFDDGPDTNYSNQISTILNTENVTATFFLIGNKINESNKAFIQELHDNGHLIGNHSFKHHKSLTWNSTNTLKKDLTKCSQTIENIINRKPLLFRPPYGVTTPRYDRAIKALGLKSIGWSLRSFDTVITDKEQLLNKLKKKTKNGSIILLHDTQQITVEILPEFIQYCKANDLKIVPLTELLNIKAYE